MTGVTFPVAMSSRMMARSCLFGLARNVTSFWLTNRDHTQRCDQTGQKTDHSPTAPLSDHDVYPLGI